MIEKIVLSLGSNVGNRLVYINKALKLISLSPDFDILAISQIYETEPWGFKNQNNFLNCVLVCLYRSSALKLIGEVKKIENIIGRKFKYRWMPREIDIDILFFGSREFRGKNLIIPHPRIQHRNFVLKPLEDLIPDFVHPVLKKTIRYLYLHSKDSCKVKLYKF
jgi:2-amino-4-hydroxy-6-hydroxymethyldihydropteridine diphosphokinase